MINRKKKISFGNDVLFERNKNQKNFSAFLLAFFGLFFLCSCFSSEIQESSSLEKKSTLRKFPSSGEKEKQSPLQKDRIYLYGRIVEVIHRFTSQEKSLLVLVDKEIPGPLFPRIRKIFLPREWVEEISFLGEGKKLWMAVTSKEKEEILDLAETKKIEKEKTLEKFLEAHPSIHSLSFSQQEGEKNLKLLSQGKDPSYFYHRLSSFLSVYLKEISGIENVNYLQQALLPLSTSSAPSALEFLGNFSSHPNPSLRLTALSVLGEMADPRALPFLSRFALDSDDEIRKWLSYYLVFLDQKGENILLEFLQNSSVEVQKQALHSLGVLRCEKVFLWIKKNPSVENGSLYPEIAFYFGRMGTPEALGKLTLWIRKLPQPLSTQALEALSFSQRDVAIPCLISLIDHPDPYISWKVLYDLGAMAGKNLGNPSSLQEKEKVKKEWEKWWKETQQKIDRPSRSR